MSHSISVPVAVTILLKHGVEPRKFAAGVHHDVPTEYAFHPYAIACGVKVVDEETEASPAPTVAPSADGDDADQEPEAETPEEIARDAALAAKGETKDELIAQAKELGLSVDKRWGLAKLQRAIDAKLAE